MSVWSRLKSYAGGSLSPPRLVIAASQTALELPSNRNVFELTAASTETLATINANLPIMPGRMIIIYGATASAAITITNNAGTTTKGQIDAGAADLTIDNDDSAILLQRANGTWIELSSHDG